MKTLLCLLLLLFSPIAIAAPGDLDTTFGAGGKVTAHIGSGNAYGRSVAVQSDGKIIVAGWSTFNGTGSQFALVRYLDNGTPDSSFGTGGEVTTDFAGSGFGRSVALQSDGKIVFAGSSYNGIDTDFALVRYLDSGALDSSFGTGGKVTTDFGGSDNVSSMALQSDGKIVVAGYPGPFSISDFMLVRYLDSGVLDTSFGTGGKVTTDFANSEERSFSVAVQSDGKIVVAGHLSSNNNINFALVRYTNGGTLDTSFGTGGKVTTDFGGSDNGRGVAVQSDGKIVVAGYSANNGGISDIALARYMASGALDTGFGTGGKVTTPIGNYNDAGLSVAVQGDGKIVVAGYSDMGGNADDDFALVRYTNDGALDTSFGTGGKVITSISFYNDGGYSVAVQSDGKIVVAGNTEVAIFPSRNSDFALVRYEGGSPGDNDSDGLLDAWELTYWSTIPGHSALDDFDGDGLPELLEEAFGLNPTLPDASGLPQPVNEGGYLTMSFIKHPGVLYEVQSAGTLVDGQPDSFSPATTTILIDDATTLKVRDNFLIGAAPARSLRLKVTAAP